MAFQFPDAPVAGDEYASGGITYAFDGTVWNIKGGGDLQDYVQKVGDLMTGNLTIQRGPTDGAMILCTGDATNNARIDWNNPDGTRKGFIGYGGTTQIEIRLDSATFLNVTGGGIHAATNVRANTGTGCGLEVGDAWHGWEWTTTYNGEILKSYQGKFGFHRTAGSVPGDLLAQIDSTGWVSGGTGRLGPPHNHNVVWQNNFAGTMDFRVNPAMVTMRCYEVMKTANALGGNTATKVCDYPSGVPAPWGTVRTFGLIHNKTGYQAQGSAWYWLEARTDGVYLLLWTGSQMNASSDHSFSGTLSWAR